MSASPTYDTGLIGLWYGNNYGAIMTAYALYCLLEKQGRAPLLLDQAPFTRNPKYCDPANMSRTFMRKHGVAVSQPLSTDAQLQGLNDLLDTFVLGSDQVWRWCYSQKEGSFYFLDFVRAEKRKIAVSASIGIDKEERPLPLQRKAKLYLQRFDAVSVREQSAVNILKDCYDVEAEWILDPVFLHGPSLFEELCEGCPVHAESYVLSYVLEPDATIRSYVETIAKERGLTIINMVDGQKDLQQLKERLGTDNVVANLTPEQWVNYIHHCSFFVTDSFHGVCFAHLFHKDFVCVAPPERGLTRFESLLGLTGLTEHLLPPDCAPDKWQQATLPIDWKRVQGILDEEREKALNWITQALTAPRAPEKELLGRVADEWLYAGSGAADRSYLDEALIQQKLAYYRRRILPRVIQLKKAVLRLLCLCPLPSLRDRLRQRIQAQRRLLRYLRSS